MVLEHKKYKKYFYICGNAPSPHINNGEERDSFFRMEESNNIAVEKLVLNQICTALGFWEPIYGEAV